MVKRTDYAGDCLHVPPDPFPVAFCPVCALRCSPPWMVSFGLLGLLDEYSQEEA